MIDLIKYVRYACTVYVSFPFSHFNIILLEESRKYIQNRHRSSGLYQELYKSRQHGQTHAGHFAVAIANRRRFAYFYPNFTLYNVRLPSESKNIRRFTPDGKVTTDLFFRDICSIPNHVYNRCWLSSIWFAFQAINAASFYTAFSDRYIKIWLAGVLSTNSSIWQSRSMSSCFRILHFVKTSVCLPLTKNTWATCDDYGIILCKLTSC